MGCGSSKILNEKKYLHQKNIKLDFDDENTELNRVQNIISLITNIRNRIIYKFHRLIYKSGACLFLQPTIILCLKCIFYKISADFNGFQKANIIYMEDPPYLKTNLGIYTKYTKSILSELFEFIVELNGYKTILKKIDKDSAELLYITFEKKGNLSQNNINKINEAMYYFKQITKLREDILKDYKQEIYNYIKETDLYIQNIDYIGLDAVQNNISDIYEIVMLKKNEISEFDEVDSKKNKMHLSIDEGKKEWQKIIDQDKDEPLFLPE
jgi:hypothetical protein